MAESVNPYRIGIMMSVAKDNSGGVLRINAIEDGLGASSYATKVGFGMPDVLSTAGTWSTPADYTAMATNLLTDGAMALFTSCYPTLNGAMKATADYSTATSTTIRPVIYAGLFNSDRSNSHNYYFADNVTGFVSHEYQMCGKRNNRTGKTWLGYLSKIANIARAAVIYEDTATGGSPQYSDISGSAPAGISITPINLTTTAISPSALENTIAKIAGPGFGLIVTTGALTASLDDIIIGLADKYGIPAIYPNRLYTARGGLMSYGANLLDLYQKAGVYLGEILSGATLPNHSTLPTVVNKEADFELAINLTTARKLGLTVSTSLLNQANWLCDYSGCTKQQ